MGIVPFDWQGAQVRTLLRDGAPWFVAADVCAVLGHSNLRREVAALDDDEHVLVNLNTAHTVGGSAGNTVTNGYGIQDQPRRGNPNMMLVSESGLYVLIFRSRLPTARAFRKWVTSEVLPALRVQGRYAMPGADAPHGAALELRFLRAASAEAVRVLARGGRTGGRKVMGRPRKQIPQEVWHVFLMVWGQGAPVAVAARAALSVAPDCGANAALFRSRLREAFHQEPSPWPGDIPRPIPKQEACK